LIPKRWVLASASPRRRQLFSLLNVPFIATAANVDEEIGEGENPEGVVCRLSLAKARAVALSYPEDVIVAADTIVALDGDVLGKPADEAEAVAMLRRLRGREHAVLSGVTILSSSAPPLSPPTLGGTGALSRVGFLESAHPTPMYGHRKGTYYHILGWVEAQTKNLPLRGLGRALPPKIGGAGRAITELAESVVWMRAYTDEEMIRYAASGDPLDKAGAYAIQHHNFSPVERIEGCYASVMGLPLCHLARALAQLGLMLPVDVPQACQGFTGHRCLVAGEILQR